MRTHFPQSVAVSVGLHVLVLLLVLAVVNYRPAVMHLPSANSELAHAIAVTLAPLRRLHPPQPPKKAPPQPPKPLPPAIETQATETLDQTPPPAAKPPPAEEPQPQEEQPVQQASYQEIAEAILAANKRYPREALLNGTEGTVVLSYIVNSQGTVLAYTIEQSSGHPVLDDEVKRLIRSVRFPPFPAGDMDTRKTLEVTIEFDLHSGGN